MKPALMFYLIGVSVVCAAAIRCLPPERKKLFHGLVGALLIISAVLQYALPH